ncbi:MAG: T9SS type A sorting domain-containing protein [Chitinophagales bacterium]
MKNVSVKMLTALITLVFSIAFSSLKAQYGVFDSLYYKGTGIDYKCTGGLVLPDSSVLVTGKFFYANERHINGLVKLKKDGSIDYSFNTGSGANDHVNVIVRQPDGKLIIGGDFTRFNNQTINRIARLNSNGSLDTSFHVGTGLNNSVYALYLQGDGKVLVAGLFTTYGGASANRIIRLNSDGSRDNTFAIGTGASAQVFSLDRLANGQYIIAGDFATFNGKTVGRVARLNSDASLDTTFNYGGTGANNIVTAAYVLPNNKIIAAGYFTQYNGNSSNRIVRLNADGSYDSTFYLLGGFNANVNELAIQADGKVLAVGGFTNYNGTAINRIVRIDTTGARDLTFKIGTGADLSLNTVFLNPDGKVYVGGTFTVIDSFARVRLARLNADGTVDQTFYQDSKFNTTVNTVGFQSTGKAILAGLFVKYNQQSVGRIARLDFRGNLDVTFNAGGAGCNGQVRCLAVQPDDKILVGGDFTKYNTTSINRICRLNADGTLDNTFTVGTGANGPVYALALQTDGKIVLTGSFTQYNGTTVNRLVRLNTNGTIDNTFTPGAGLNNYASDIAIQTDGKIIVVGIFTMAGGVSKNRIARFNANGTLDVAYNIGTASPATLYTVALQTDGKAVVGGAFTTFNGAAHNRIVRLNTDGTVDSTYTVSLNNIPYKLLNFRDGMFTVGVFSQVNGITRNRAAYIDMTGRVDSATFNYKYGTTSGVPMYAAFNKEERRIFITGTFTDYDLSIANKVARVNAANVEVLWPTDTLCKGGSFYLSCKSLNMLTNGNAYKVQLSDSAGYFTNPLVIGTKSSTSLVDSVLINIPANIPYGDNYRIRILTTAPSDTSYYSAPFSIAPLPTPMVTANGPTSFCQGNMVTLNCQTATTYLWSNGNTTPSVTAIATDNYVVTTTNKYGCIAVSNPVSVTVHAAPDSAINITAANFCNGGTAQISAPAGYMYNWSTGATTQSISVTTAGTYSVSITTNNGCTSDSSYYINPANFSTNLITPSGSVALCQGQSLSLSSIPAAGITYNWSTTQTSQSISVNASGNYSVTLTDASNCTASSSIVTVAVNNLPDATINATANAVCAGSSVALNGQPGLTYSWSNGQTNQLISVTAAGTYTLTVTDGNNCSAVSSKTIAAAALPNTNITYTGSANLCPGSSLQLNAAAGLNYAWSSGETTQTITVGNAGNYIVTVTDATTNCSASSNAVTVNVYTAPDASINSTATQICPFSYATLSGASGLSYNWSNNQHTSSIVAQPGAYSLTVTDGHNCSASSSYVLNSLPMPDTLISASGPTTICSGESVTLTAGTGLTYHWNNNFASQSITVNASGSYKVTVTDGATNCSAVSQTVAVTVNAAPQVTYDLPQTTICNTSAVIQLNAGLPAGGNLYVNGVNATQIDPSQYANSNVVVTYIVTDANGCEGYKQDSVFIAVCTDVQETPSESSISVYPNPASNFLVVYDANGTISDLRIVDMLGQTVLQENVTGQNHVKLNISQLASGNYFVVAGKKTFKFLKTE